MQGCVKKGISNYIGTSIDPCGRGYCIVTPGLASPVHARSGSGENLRCRLHDTFTHSPGQLAKTG